jgi:hypothetical protein
MNHMIGSLKAILETGKKLVEVRDAAARSELIVQFTRQIMDAQNVEAGLIEKIHALEQKITEFEDWKREKDRYQLEELPPGILMYRLKEGMENGEPIHKICANCYINKKKSLLHNLGTHNGLTEWKCHSCGFKESTGHFSPPPTEPDESNYFL